MKLLLFLVCLFFVWFQFRKIKKPDKYGADFSSEAYFQEKLFGKSYAKFSHFIAMILAAIFAVVFL